MKKTALAVILVSTLLFSAAAGILNFEAANANFVPAADISITSPANKTYTSNLLVLNYTAYFSLTENKQIVYSLDGGTNVTILNKQSSEFYATFNEQVPLPKLSDGPHHLEVYAVYVGSPGFAEVYFTISTPPTISIISVENKTYYSTDVPLNFTVEGAFSQISYSIDNQENMTINGNLTLVGLAEGSHSLVVYANDTAGNMGSSEAINFTIARELEPQPEPFPIVPVIASIAAVAIVSASLMVYFKKYRHGVESA